MENSILGLRIVEATYILILELTFIVSGMQQKWKFILTYFQPFWYTLISSGVLYR